MMGMQLKYVFPFIIGAISYSTSSAIALYFITTNIAGSIQEWHVRRVLDVMRKEPRYVLGVADQVPPDGLESRVRRVFELVEAYGRF